MKHTMKPVVAALLALSIVATVGTVKLIHSDEPLGTWLGFCESRIHVPGLGDVVIQYWEIDDTPGLSRGDRIYSRRIEPCLYGKPWS